MYRIVLLPFFTTLSILFLFTCDANPTVNLPIDEEALVKVLCDVHVVEGALQNQKASEKDSLAKAYYNQIYEKHDIQEQDFVKTLEAMEKNPKLLGQIYEQVLVELDSIEELSYKGRYKKK
jgi:hypothetical protein